MEPGQDSIDRVTQYKRFQITDVKRWLFLLSKLIWRTCFVYRPAGASLKGIVNALVNKILLILSLSTYATWFYSRKSTLEQHKKPVR